MGVSDLTAVLAQQGAVPVDDRGVTLPRHFGDAAAEYEALREGTALLHLGHRTVVSAHGADRAGFLQGMLTNEVAGLRPGQGCGALLLTIQGRVTADVRVAVCEEVILLDVDVRAREAFLGALEQRLVADDVEFTARSEVLLGLEGPQAGGTLGAEGDPAPYAHVVTTVGEVPTRVVHASEVGGPGYVLHVPADAAGRVWAALAAKGARPCGLEALEARRIELGIPRIGLDMDEGILALEVPVEHLISQSKGCYLGQEVVARGTARGHVNRRLCGVLLSGPARCQRTPLLRDGREVGFVTSVGHAFGIGAAAALAMVRRECWDPGTELTLAESAPPVVVRVATLPLA